jgi:hypothetical protein
MEANKLLLMAENICANFSAYPEEQRTQQTITHIEQFWTPAMRKDLKSDFSTNEQAYSPALKLVVKKI